ncbi:MAG: hypothetical protein HOV79_35150 [Hamadaea sp.]|nr:hypothetical protein [Hamadaea sp.]
MVQAGLRKFGVVAVTALAAATMIAGPAEAETTAAGCVVTGATDAATASLRSGGLTVDAEGLYPYQQYLAGATGQAATAALVGVEDEVFGHLPSDAGLPAKLRRGLIGFTPDYAAQALVAVVTPDYTDTARLQAALDTARVSLGAGAPALRVQTGCFGADTLADAERIIRGYAWRPAGSRFAFAYDLNPVDSKLYVTVDARQEKAAAALAGLLGDRGVVTLGELSRMGRLNDGEPHFGGAGIRKGYSSNTASNTCTSGFLLRDYDFSHAGITTAGHCFIGGAAIYSSTQYYGQSITPPTGEYPATDVMLIYSANETYDNVIHVDPCSPCTRTVNAKSYVVPGSAVCLSGMVTKAICSVIITGEDVTMCDGYGCTYGLLRGYRNGNTIVRAGDSGGPVYIRNGSTTASAVGTIVGGSGGRTSTSTTVYIQPYDTIEAALGRWIATS